MSRQVATYGMLVALAFLLSYVETLIPFSFGIPGIKPGLANLVTVAALFCMGERQACSVSLVRVVLAGFTFGSLSVMLYSLAGALLSLICMIGLKRFWGWGMIPVSMAGGAAHNLGQLLLAAWMVRTGALLYYFPVLFAAGAAAGFVVGLLGGLVAKRIRPVIGNGE